MNFSTEQILSFAPDDSSIKAGRSLATPSKWQKLGQSERALWGECLGSGSKPYQTQIDLPEPAFKCSCPSRKFPCKHGIGLLLLFASQPDLFANSAPPDWVNEWLSRREEQAQRKAARETKAIEEPDEATLARRDAQRAKRALDRESKVAAGLQELELWLRDLVRQGLASLQTRPLAFWDHMAARLVDAQAPGVARRVRTLSFIPQSGDGWTERLLTQMGSLFLLVKAYQRMSTLAPNVQADVRTAIGWTIKEEELPQDNLVSDEWYVLGQRTSGEEALRVHRTWLWGKRTGKGALILEFAPAGQPLASNLMSGTSLEAELLFYPGSYPVRAIVRNRLGPPQPSIELSGFGTNTQLLAQFTDGLSRNPWLEAIPAALNTVIPVRTNDRWFIRDAEDRLLAMSRGSEGGWKLTSLSGGNLISIFGEWNGTTFLPLSAVSEGRFVPI
jgi:hypothetical protein